MVKNLTKEGYRLNLVIRMFELDFLQTEEDYRLGMKTVRRMKLTGKFLDDLETAENIIEDLDLPDDYLNPRFDYKSLDEWGEEFRQELMWEHVSPEEREKKKKQDELFHRWYTEVKNPEAIPFDIKYRPEIEAGKYRVEMKNGFEVKIKEWDSALYREDGDPYKCGHIIGEFKKGLWWGNPEHNVEEWGNKKGYHVWDGSEECPHKPCIEDLVLIPIH